MGLANIETVFERMAKALERIADAAEVAQRAFAPKPKVTVASPALEKATNDALNVLEAQAPKDFAPHKSHHEAMAGGSGAPIAYEMINKAVLGYSDRYGQAAAIELLKRFGAKIIKDLKANPEKYAEVLEAIQAGP
jgi:hypothetical protein